MPYSREIADYICDEMAEGRALKEICRTARETNPQFPSAAAVRRWVVYDEDGIAARYARARDAQAMTWADEVLEIADDQANDWVERQTERGRTVREIDREHVTRSQLRVESRKWLLAKLHPTLFAERIAHQTLGADGKPIDPTQLVIVDGRPTMGKFLGQFGLEGPTIDAEPTPERSQGESA